MIPPTGAGPGAAPGGPWLAAPRTSLALAPGSVVTATVEVVAGQVAWLRLGGARVPVQAQVPLAPGQTLRLWVARTGGPIWLRVLGTADDASLPAPGSPPGAAGLAAAEPPPAGPLLATAARALVAYRLPLNPAQLHKVARLLPAFAPAEQEMAASAAAWLLAAGLAPHLGCGPPPAALGRGQARGPGPYPGRPGRGPPAGRGGGRGARWR